MEETLRSTVGRAAEVPRNRRHSGMGVKYSNSIVTFFPAKKIDAFSDMCDPCSRRTPELDPSFSREEEHWLATVRQHRAGSNDRYEFTRLHCLWEGL